MNKITVKIDGMHCPECEARVNDLFRKNCPHVVRVKSSNPKKQTVILSDVLLDEETVKKALDGSGYRVEGVKFENNLKASLAYKIALRFHKEPVRSNGLRNLYK